MGSQVSFFRGRGIHHYATNSLIISFASQPSSSVGENAT